MKSIKVILPVMSNLELTEDETIIYKVLSKAQPKSMCEITGAVPFGKSKTTTLIKTLVEKHYVSVIGNGRGTKYQISQ